MTDDKDQELRALRERVAKLEASGEQVVVPTAIAPVQPKPKGMGGCGVAAVVVSGLVVAGWLIATIFSSGAPSGGFDIAQDIKAQQSLWTPPSGYSVHETEGGDRIGIEWTKPSRSECRGGGVTCFAVNLVSEKDCPRNLYASITLFDAANRNIGWTNDTAQGVRANEPIRLVFTTYTENVDAARVAELSCY